MCEHEDECEYKDIKDGGCSHYDGRDCRNGEKLSDEIEYLMEEKE